MTIELQTSALPLARVNRPLPNLLLQGFKLGLRNWPCVVWTYAFNLLFAVLGGIPLSSGLLNLDHSLAAKNIAGTIDASYLRELELQIRGTAFFPIAVHTAVWLNVLQVLVLFVLFAGSVFIFVSAEPPRLSVLLRGGIAYFWRFVRAAIVAGFAALLILGLLSGLRGLLLDRAANIYVGRQFFLYSAISAGLIFLVALLVRLWWDLVEAYIVRNAMDGERRILPALLPAWRLLVRHFFRVFGSFFVAGLASIFAFALCLFLWRLLPAHQVWIACLLAQLGLFLLLAGRFWQRGIEATLVMAADPPRIALDAMEPEDDEVLEQGGSVTGNSAYLPGLSEPTLRDLVLKLRTEPLANPDVLAGSSPISESDSIQTPAKPAEVINSSVSRFERHEAKFPLGGVTPEKEPAPTEPGDAQAPENPDKSPHSEKKPLP
ncbi:MAG TPA: hypothetical protein VN828_22660 [Acidobacteriaceae bacterium]|nr:hypothetical protein [Acidobacteriaceae bacterium]